MPRWQPFHPPSLRTTAGPLGVEFEMEALGPEAASTDGPSAGGQPADGEATYGRAVAVFYNAAYQFMVEVWTKSPGLESRLEEEAFAWAERLVKSREWEQAPGKVYTTWLEG